MLFLIRCFLDVTLPSELLESVKIESSNLLTIFRKKPHQICLIGSEYVSDLGMLS